MRTKIVILAAAALLAQALGAASSAANAKAAPPPPAPPAVTYADLADLADSASITVRAQVRDVTALEPERAHGVRAGWGRFYVEARTRALIAGNTMLGEVLKYLVDMPLDAKGRPPSMKGKDVLLFARLAPRRPETANKWVELQLVAPDAQVLWDPVSETRLRAILTELQSADAPKRIRGLREAIYVPGNLAGESETQMFLATADGSAASIVVVRKPGQPAQWGVTFSEVLDDALKPPTPETIAWYRLACFMPPRLPDHVNVSASPADKAAAADDYALVRRELGDCPRNRH
jgi:hypothetical protein